MFNKKSIFTFLFGLVILSSIFSQTTIDSYSSIVSIQTASNTTLNYQSQNFPTHFYISFDDNTRNLRENEMLNLLVDIDENGSEDSIFVIYHYNNFTVFHIFSNIILTKVEQAQFVSNTINEYENKGLIFSDTSNNCRVTAPAGNTNLDNLDKIGGKK